jgi:hypothetical protein
VPVIVAVNGPQFVQLEREIVTTWEANENESPEGLDEPDSETVPPFQSPDVDMVIDDVADDPSWKPIDDGLALMAKSCTVIVTLVE